MEITVDMSESAKAPARKNDIDKIIDFIHEKKGVLDTFLFRPLHELHKNIVYRGMLKDDRMKKIVGRIISDFKFRNAIHEKILYTFGSNFTRNLGRIILPPGSPWP